MNNLSPFIKYHRKKAGLTQEELAEKAGVGIRFIREMEQGKETLQLDKVEQVLSLFGYSLSPARQRIDPYDIIWNYFNKPVKITLKNKVVKYGILVKELLGDENRIVSWKFVANNNARDYQMDPDDKYTEVLMHNDIHTIEEQQFIY